MWRFIPVLCAALLAGTPVAAQAPAGKSYELRTYYAAPGRLDELHARFRAHSLPLLNRHGAEVVGTWVPKPNPDNAVVALLAYPSAAARESIWSGIVADPQWTALKRADARGLLVQNVGELPLVATTAIKRKVADGDLELRTHATPEATPGAIAAFVPTRPTAAVGMVSLHPRRADALAVRSKSLVTVLMLTEPEDGDRVTVLSPTDYSPLK